MVIKANVTITVRIVLILTALAFPSFPFLFFVPQNDKGQIPADVVPDPVDMPLEMADAAASAKEIKQMLLDAVPLSCDVSTAVLPNSDNNVTGKAMLESLGLKLGDRVVIAGQKVCRINEL